MSVFRDFQRAASTSRSPVTVALIVLIVAGFLLSWFVPSSTLPLTMVFSPGDALIRPWTFVTFPFVSGGSFAIVSTLFACMWLWGVGGTTEREDGSVRFIGIWLLASGLAGAGLLVGHLLTGEQALLYTPWTPIAALTVIWGTRHPDVQVNFMFVLSITAKWVAWISALFVFFGTNPPQMAPFGALPLILAYFYAARRLPSLKLPKRETYVRGAGAYREDYFDDVRRREKSREERERLKKLFESSLDEDSGEEK